MGKYLVLLDPLLCLSTLCEQWITERVGNIDAEGIEWSGAGEQILRLPTPVKIGSLRQTVGVRNGGGPVSGGQWALGRGATNRPTRGRTARPAHAPARARPLRLANQRALVGAPWVSGGRARRLGRLCRSSDDLRLVLLVVPTK